MTSKRFLGCACALVAVISGVGCAAQVGSEDEQLGRTSSALTSLQVTDVANIYNVGVANGFLLSFTSVGDWSNAQVSFGQQRQYWPGGPLMNNPGNGSSITTDGLRLKSYDWSMPWSFTAAQSNTTSISAYLSSRTAFSQVFWIGSLISSAEMQANFALTFVGNGMYADAERSITYAKENYNAAMSIVYALCRPSATATTFDYTAMKSGIDNFNGVNIAYSTGAYGPGSFRTMIINQRTALGAVVSNQSKLWTGVAGPGCY